MTRRSRRREDGGIVALLLALLAAMTLTTVITVRHGYQRHHQARRAHLRAVARNLAEAGIAAGLAAKRPGSLIGPSISTLGNTVQVVKVDARRQSLPGGRIKIVASAEIRSPRHGPDHDPTPRRLRYVIEATFDRPRGAGGRRPVLSWNEHQ